MKKTFFVWSVLWFSFINATAQNVYTDSLKQQLVLAKADTNKIIILLLLADFYTWSYADTSLMYTHEAMNLAQELNYERGIEWAEGQMSRALITSGNYPLALDYGFKALASAEKNNSTGRIMFALTNIAMCYRDQGDISSSLIYCRKALTLSNTIQLDKLNQSTLWGIASSVYEKNDLPDSAILYAKKAYEIQNDWSGILYVLGSAYTQKNDYDSAMFYYRTGIPAAVLSHTEIDLIDIYNGIANVQKAKGNLDSAAWYSKKALAEKVGKNYPLGLLHSANMLVDIYEIQNKDDSTLKYLRTSLQLKDSLFNREKTIAIQNLAFKEREKQKEIEASKLKYQNQYKMYSLLGILFTVLAIAVVLFRSNRQRQKAYALLQEQKEQIDSQKREVEQTLSKLKNTQNQLIQSEKMASLGELTAGIAHEIQNPLNFVKNFSELNRELIGELKQDLEKGDIADAKNLAEDLERNLEKVEYHGKRADAIIKGMLQHSQSNSGTKELTHINALADEYLRLAYHGLRGKDNTFNVTLKTDFDPAIGNISIIPQDIGRVLLNLYNNAFYAVNEKRRSNQHDIYESAVIISTRKLDAKVEIRVVDNGIGIPQKVIDKIFQPFFTTKPTGQGTGLGLSLSYDIIKAHGGEIKVLNKPGEGAEFIITLPIV